MKKGNFVDAFVDALFDPKKRAVLLFFLIALIIRIVAALNLQYYPDDAGQAIAPLGIFGSGKLSNWAQSTVLWYYIQGVFYTFFGPTVLASRLGAVLFGSFSVLLMFAFIKRVFKSEKAALIGSFIVAISPILIKNTLSEMDVAVCFFVLLSAYFLFGFIETNKRKELLASALIIGIGVMIKLYVLFFAFSFILFLIYMQFKKEKDVKNIVKNILLFGIIVSVLVVPTLAHNYLLYKDKGYMDLIFTNTLRLGVDKAAQYYNWGAGWLAYSDYRGFFLGNQKNFDPTPVPGALVLLWSLFNIDPVLLIFGLCGLIFIYKKHRAYFIWYLIVLIPAYVYLGAQIPLEKHFVWSFFLLIPCASMFIENVSSKIKPLKIYYILAIILVFNLFYLGMPSSMYGEASMNKLIGFKSSIPNNALVVVDSRIYRLDIHWFFAGTHYVEGSQFIPIAQQLIKQGPGQPIEVYYIECVTDDCGWGTVAKQPEFNKSMEQLTEFFANRSVSQQNFDGPIGNKYYSVFSGEKQIRYRAYKTTLTLNPAILDAVDKTHVWFLYPLGYDRSIAPIFDDYVVYPGIDTIIDYFAWLVLYFELVASYVLLLYAIYVFVDEEKENSARTQTVSTAPIVEATVL